MNTFRKILTSTALAAVMAVSVSIGASAKKAESDINSVSVFQNIADGITVELNGVETVLSEAEFLELKDSVGKREYLEISERRTNPGKSGWITISSGIYTVTYNPYRNVFKKYYGVSAEIIGFDHDLINLNTEMNIDYVFCNDTDTYCYSNSKIGDALNFEMLDTGFTKIYATVSTSDDWLGDSYQQINYDIR